MMRQLSAGWLVSTRYWAEVFLKTPSPFSRTPGTGKTILAQHFVFHNATPQRPALYCSTVSEPLDKILRYGQTLSLTPTRSVDRSSTRTLAALPSGLTVFKRWRPALIRF